MRKNKYYDYAFNVKGYPCDCALVRSDALVFNWLVDLSGVVLIPYKSGVRTVRLEKPVNPTWNNDGNYSSKSCGGKNNLVGLLGEMVVLDLLEHTGVTMGSDLISLNYRLNPDSPAKSWGVKIPDIQVNEDLDKTYIEVKTSLNERVRYKRADYNGMVAWSDIDWNNGALKVVGVQLQEVPLNSGYDFVFMYLGAYVLPHRDLNTKYIEHKFNKLSKTGDTGFLPKLEMKRISSLTDIFEYINNTTYGF